MNSNNFDRMTTGLANTTSRRQALKLMAGGILGGAAMTAGIKGVAAQQGSQRGPTGGPGSWSNEFTGTVLEGATAGDEFSGVMEITRFSNKGGQLSASGNIYQGGEFVDTFTAAVSHIEVDPESAKLASVVTGRASDVSLAQDAECQILYLELAPLFLDVLGLVIELPNALILDIYAVEGGGLLGDLLCAVAGLLEGGGPLQQITGLLNQILGILAGL